MQKVISSTCYISLPSDRTRLALQALPHSIDAKDGHNEGKISTEQVHRLSDKLGELLGDAEGTAGPSDSRNERGEVCSRFTSSVLGANH